MKSTAHEYLQYHSDNSSRSCATGYQILSPYHTCPLYYNIIIYMPIIRVGVGKEAHINWSVVKPEKTASITRTTLRTTSPVPADSWQ